MTVKKTNTGKVDYEERQREFNRKFWFGYVPLLLIIGPGLTFLSSMLGWGLSYHSRDRIMDLLLVIIVLLLIFVVLLLHQAIAIAILNVLDHGRSARNSLELLFMVVYFFLFLGLLFLFGSRSLEFSFMFVMGNLVFVVAVVSIFIYFTTKRVKGLTVYSRVLASAEQKTGEYLDGYSQRPVSFDFKKASRKGLLRFGRFLLSHDLIVHIRRMEESIIFFFPATLIMDPMKVTPMVRPEGSAWKLLPLAEWGTRFSFMLNFKSEFSYLRIYHAGRAEVYFTPREYEFLGEQVSYHLLCQKVAERMRRAYRRFAKGKEKRALDVFRIKKGGT